MHPMFKSKNAGFSLIELMVVITIIGVIAAMGLPVYDIQLIKAARAERRGIMKMGVVLNEAYKEDNEQYTNASLYNGSYTISITYGGSTTTYTANTSNCDAANALGWTADDCRKLRSSYFVAGYGAYGHPTIASDYSYTTIASSTAYSYDFAFTWTFGAITISYSLSSGSVPVAKRCPNPNPLDYESYENQDNSYYVPFYNSTNRYDAVKYCYGT